MKVHDPVNSPLHYKREGVECIDAMKQTRLFHFLLNLYP